MNELIKKFESKMKLKVKEVYKTDDVYLFIALPHGSSYGDDPFYITDKNVDKVKHFTPPEDFNLYQKFMKNQVYGG